MAAAASNQTEERLPVSLLTGFLGSGKTTVLSKFLRHPGMANTVVIMNEFGEVGLDHELVQAPEQEVILLNNGCLCCAVLGDLITTFTRLFERRAAGEIPRFDRIVIETSGLADPAPILHTLITDPEVTSVARLDTIVTIVDAVNAPTQLSLYFECVKQIAVADRIVVSKADLAEAAQIEELRKRLLRINPGAEIQTVIRGDIGPEILFSAASVARENDRSDLEAWLGGAERQGALHEHKHDHHEAHSHGDSDGRHEKDVQTLSFWLDDPVHPMGLEMWLDQLSTFRGPNLLRVKGILNVDGRPATIHAVQHLFHPPEYLDQWPSEERRSRIVFITHKLDRAEIEATLSLLAIRPPTRDSMRRAIDPVTFGQFSAAMRRMQGLTPE